MTKSEREKNPAPPPQLLKSPHKTHKPRGEDVSALPCPKIHLLPFSLSVSLSSLATTRSLSFVLFFLDERRRRHLSLFLLVLVCRDRRTPRAVVGSRPPRSRALRPRLCPLSLALGAFGLTMKKSRRLKASGQLSLGSFDVSSVRSVRQGRDDEPRPKRRFSGRDLRAFLHERNRQTKRKETREVW